MKKRNIRGFFVGDKGQRLFNYAYSIGASVVIVGALFKLLHWPFADFILIVGMGTEAAIFFLSAFDEPAKDYKWEKVYPELDYPEEEDRPTPSLPLREGAPVHAPEITTAAPVASSNVPAGNVTIIGSGMPAGGTIVVNGGAPANNVGNIQASSLRGRTEEGPVPTFNINTEEVSDATQKYVEQLKSISEQMVALNRSVQGIEAIYEVQLKSASSQLGSVEQVSEQTKQLVQNLQQLNELYGRMISAMAPSQQKQ